ncbi:hypothetical protein HETIRDRAFT_234074, partial [Heterobasidion irregulare TC 32-1]
MTLFSSVFLCIHLSALIRNLIMHAQLFSVAGSPPRCSESLFIPSMFLYFSLFVISQVPPKSCQSDEYAKGFSKTELSKIAAV